TATVNIIPEAYLGKNFQTVQSELSAMDLDVTVQSQVDPNSAPDTVIALSRSGRVEVGSPITITYAKAPPPSPEPTQTTMEPQPTSTQSAPATAGLPTCSPGAEPVQPPTCAP
ncbi:MAG: protein kinase, partial [Cellulosimicrobium cellulans]